VYLLEEVEKYLRQSDVAPTRFRREAVGDPRFVFDLRNGRDARPTTIARVRAYLEAAGTMNRLPLSAAALRLLKR
jgi:hypothetical protein